VLNEGVHFTVDRIAKILVTFGILYLCLLMIDIKVSNRTLGYGLKACGFILFILYSAASTAWHSRQIRKIHRIKRRDQYEFDENDLHFDSRKTVTYLVGMCFLSGLLSGTLGIAGGTIMSPLFLSLGMLPSVTAATNQYIGMISSLSVSMQFM
jgi:uncharacterized membrane protein YfcA